MSRGLDVMAAFRRLPSCSERLKWGAAPPSQSDPDIHEARSNPYAFARATVSVLGQKTV